MIYVLQLPLVRNNNASFFETTITAEQYQEHVQSFIASLEENKVYCWLQQDNVTAHEVWTVCGMIEYIPSNFIAHPWAQLSKSLSSLFYLSLCNF